MLWLGVWLGFFRAPLSNSNPQEAVPSNAAFVLTVKHHNTFINELKALDYYKNISAIGPLSEWIDDMKKIDNLFSDKDLNFQKNIRSNQFSSLSLNGNEFAWTHIIALSNFNLKQFLKSEGISIKQKSSFLKNEIFEIETSSKVYWTLAYSRGLLIISKQLSFVESALLSLHNVGNNLPFDKRYRSVKNSSADIAFYANLELSSIFLSLIGSEASLAADPILRDFSWSGGELKFEKENFVLGGKMSFKDRNSFWNWLSQQNQETENSIAGLIPLNFAFLRFLNIKNFGQQYRKIEKNKKNEDFEKYVLPWLDDESLFLITEPTGIDFNNDKFFILETKDSLLSDRLLKEYGNNLGILEAIKIRDFELIKISAAELLKPIFGADLGEQKLFYMLRYGNYMIFSASSSIMDVLLENLKHKKTLEHSDRLKHFAGQIKQPSTAYYFINSSVSLPFLKAFADIKHEKILLDKFENLKNIGPIGIQLKSLGTGLFSLTATFSYQKSEEIRNDLNLAWRCNLDAEAAIKPAFVLSSDGKESEIMIQDKEKRLYLLDRRGQIKWKKPIEGIIRSDFHQIDYYNNGELYYVFNTDRQIYILDKNGDILKQIQLAAKASNGISIIGDPKNIGFYIGCSNGKVYGYDKNGKPMPGWNPNKSTGTVDFPIQYYESADKKIIISLNRKGRLHLAKKNGEAIKTYFLKGYFRYGPFLDTVAGRIVICNTDGKIEVINFEGKKFGIAAVKNIDKDVSFFLADINADGKSDYLRQSKNMLSAYSYDEKNKLIETLVYTYSQSQVEIFPIKMQQKIYIGSYNATAGEISILNPEGKMINGFPIKSDAGIAVSDFFKDGSNTLLYTKAKVLSAIKIK